MSQFKIPLAFLIAWTALVGIVSWTYEKTMDVPVTNSVVLANVNGDSASWATSNVVLQARRAQALTPCFIWLVGAMSILFPLIRRLVKSSGSTPAALILVSLMFLGSGCRAPYDVPEFKEITPNQTAYVIPMDTDTGKQVKFASEAFLEQAKVATKRIEIPHRWVQDGRISSDGHYIPSVMVIVVDRAPVTREWKNSGKANKETDKAIWTESADSVGFSMGWTVTGYIQEKDTSKFLYWYPSGSLANVIDTEVRGRIQMVSAQESAKYPLDVLRTKKNEIGLSVRTDITEFFTARGITITSIGQFGGMEYENPQIQEAIDKTFITQQEKVNAKSMLEAQGDKNLRITQEAEALAEASRRKAKGEADGLESINKALEKAANNPQLLQLRALEVERVRIEKWQGTYPSVVSGAGANTWIGLGNAPTEQPVKATK